MSDGDDTPVKGHFLGTLPDGGTVVEACEDGKEPRIFVGRRPQPGKPIPPEQLEKGLLGTMRQHEDGHHVEIVPHREERHGPIKVSTPAFRDGWDRTFGGGGGQAN